MQDRGECDGASRGTVNIGDPSANDPNGHI